MSGQQIVKWPNITPNGKISTQNFIQGDSRKNQKTQSLQKLEKVKFITFQKKKLSSKSEQREKKKYLNFKIKLKLDRFQF